MTAVAEQGSRAALYALLLWAPLARGAYEGWALAVLQLLTLAGLALWVVSMTAAGRLEWRRSAVDLPLAVFFTLTALQIALGNGAVRAWALGPAVGSGLEHDLAVPVLGLGTVSPLRTMQATLLFATYVGVYVLVVHVLRTRRQVERLVAGLVSTGAILAFAGLLDYLLGEPWLVRWSEQRVLSRVAATFVNADHFASWLAMLLCLGVGLMAGPRRHRRSGTEGHPWGSTAIREQIARRSLTFIALGVLALALVFTQSRGGILSIIVGLATIVALFGRVGRVRRSVVVVAGLLGVTLIYAAWIGLSPVLARMSWEDARWTQWMSTLTMLRDFPVLGVGLGAYRDIYFRYQPLSLQPGKMFFPYAHNDILQLLIELGIPGAAAFVFAVWRVARDLVGAHLCGTCECPAGAEFGLRYDSFSVGVAIGAVGAFVSLMVHSVFDFSARIPANGVLAAACLGIATVTVHTRFSANDEWLGAIRRLRSGYRTALVLVPGLLAVALVGAWFIARPPWNEVRSLALRAESRLATARYVWSTGLAHAGQPVGSFDDRRRESLALAEGAVGDATRALHHAPSDPFLHERLAWSHVLLTAVDVSHETEHRTQALSHFQRAIFLAPRNPYLHRALAVAAATQPPNLAMALAAARGAIANDAQVLPDLVDRLWGLGLDERQWLATVPESWLDRVELGGLLDKRGRSAEATAVFRAALDVAPADAKPIATWFIGRALVGQRRYLEAQRAVDEVLVREPMNPELHRLRADALAGLEQPAALDEYRLAVDLAVAAAREPVKQVGSFGATSERAVRLVREGLGRLDGPIRYRHALARYLTERGRWDQAVQAWQVVLAEAPDDAEALFLQGSVLERLGARDQAVESYRRAIGLEARAAFRLRLARVLWETEQYFQAMNEWRAVLQADPETLEARVALGDAYLKAGDRIAAFQEYQYALKVAPESDAVRERLRRFRSR